MASKYRVGKRDNGQWVYVHSFTTRFCGPERGDSVDHVNLRTKADDAGVYRVTTARWLANELRHSTGADWRTIRA